MTQAQAACTGMTEYRQRLKGWVEDQHERWELTRWLAWHQYNLSPFLKKGQRPKTPKDVQTFPWEEGAKKPTKRQARKKAKITDTERAALDAIMKDFYKRKYGENPAN